jgi:hypothetical protein
MKVDDLIPSDSQKLIDKKLAKRTQNMLIELKQFNTKRLKPLKIDNLKGKEGYIKLKPDGWIIILHPKQSKKLYFSPDGSIVQIKPKHAISKYGILEYKFERLPHKLRPWYKYVSDFVALNRTKTPRIIYANNVLKCCMMENDPKNTFEVDFIKPREQNLRVPRAV